MKALPILILLLARSMCLAVDWPEGDAALDKLLKDKSPEYRRMAAAVESSTPYRIISDESTKLGDVWGDGAGLLIKLNPRLSGARRATVLIWEMGNAYQRPRFAEMTRRVKERTITSHTEYGLRMELIEYDTFRYHRAVLVELDASLGPVGQDFLFFINPPLNRLDE
jgi:hypothetical protein